MIRNEENTKAAIGNSDSNPIEAYDREIKRLEEIKRTLDNEFLYHPAREYFAPDLRKFLEGYPKIKANIEHYIRNSLECLSMSLYNRKVIQRYRKRVVELEQQLKEKENDTELH